MDRFSFNPGVALTNFHFIMGKLELLSIAFTLVSSVSVVNGFGLSYPVIYVSLIPMPQDAFKVKG